MGPTTRVLGALGFVLFVEVLALCLFLANPALAGTLRNGLGGWQTLAVLPLLLVMLLVIALRLRSPSEGPDSRELDSDRGESFWDTRKADNTDVDLAGDRSTGEADADDTQAVEARQTDAADRGSSEMTGPLGGQGGTRDRELEIEEQPPDPTLSEHLEHLQAELDGDETVAGDLQTLEAVARESEDGRTVPARCPQDHCDAVWTGRTVLGIGSGRYERLEDGRRVRCLNCEERHTLE